MLVNHTYKELDETLAGCISAEFEFTCCVRAQIEPTITNHPETSYAGEGAEVLELEATEVKLLFDYPTRGEHFQHTVTLLLKDAQAFFEFMCNVNPGYRETVEELCVEESREVTQ